MTVKHAASAKRIKAADLKSRIVSVRTLLADSALEIPTYQRPYKWTAKHINQHGAENAPVLDRQLAGDDGGLVVGPVIDC